MAKLDFRQRRSVPNYLGRREQGRLLLLVMALGGVYLLTAKAADPRNFHWFFQVSGLPVEDEAAEPVAGDPEVDTVVRRSTAPSDIPDAFTAPLPAHRAAQRKYFPGVQAEHLASVRDDTVFRRAEHAAFFHLLDVLRRTDDTALAAASQEEVAFAQLYRQPDQYRGELVTLRGAIRRAQRLKAPRNAYGIAAYHQVWVQPAYDPTLPIVVYVLELPPEFPSGLKLNEPVVLTGFFFKRWLYQAEEIRSTPLLLARTVTWQRPVSAPQDESNATQMMIFVATVSLLGLAGMLAFKFLHVHNCHEPPRVAGRPPLDADFDALRDAELIPSPEIALERLAQAHAEGRGAGPPPRESHHLRPGQDHSSPGGDR